MLVAFSCKGRGLCPSCGAKRSAGDWSDREGNTNVEGEILGEWLKKRRDDESPRPPDNTTTQLAYSARSASTGCSCAA
jgi:hypothetical protein